jgi:hypothetical protein
VNILPYSISPSWAIPTTTAGSRLDLLPYNTGIPSATTTAINAFSGIVTGGANRCVFPSLYLTGGAGVWFLNASIVPSSTLGATGSLSFASPFILNTYS